MSFKNKFTNKICSNINCSFIKCICILIIHVVHKIYLYFNKISYKFNISHIDDRTSLQQKREKRLNAKMSDKCFKAPYILFILMKELSGMVRQRNVEKNFSAVEINEHVDLEKDVKTCKSEIENYVAT